jgi:FKBP-type peptidyl-prolyl cis-trans isomerase (trigger factor)
MIKSYKITYQVDGDDYIEYFYVQKESEGKYVGISAQNSFYDEVIFNFNASKSIKEIESLLESGVATAITQEGFVDGFNRMLKGVERGYKKKYGRQQ